VLQEITRRVNMHNIWQAAYTAGAILPKPVSVTRYWHRSLNPKKLIDIGFSKLQVLLTAVPLCTRPWDAFVCAVLQPNLFRNVYFLLKLWKFDCFPVTLCGCDRRVCVGIATNVHLRFSCQGGTSTLVHRCHCVCMHTTAYHVQVQANTSVTIWHMTPQLVFCLIILHFWMAGATRVSHHNDS
jgi:hypothetical protein